MISESSLTDAVTPSNTSMDNIVNVTILTTTIASIPVLPNANAQEEEHKSSMVTFYEYGSHFRLGNFLHSIHNCHIDSAHSLATCEQSSLFAGQFGDCMLGRPHWCHSKIEQL